MHELCDLRLVSFCFSLQQLTMKVLTICMEKMSAQNAAGASDAQGPDTTTPERQLQKCLQEHQCQNKRGRMLMDYPHPAELISEYYSKDYRNIGNNVAAESSTTNNLLAGTQTDGAIFQTPPRARRRLTSMSPGLHVLEVLFLNFFSAGFLKCLIIQHGQVSKSPLSVQIL